MNQEKKCRLSAQQCAAMPRVVSGPLTFHWESVPIVHHKVKSLTVIAYIIISQVNVFKKTIHRQYT